MKQNKYENITTVLNMVREAQDAERDMRNAAREAKNFITKRDGQWQDTIIKKFDGNFRGTFDMCTPIIDNIAGEIDQSDFTLRVSPAGGEASEQIAKTYDGIIRNIRNISNAEMVFQQAGRSNVIGGFDAWEIVQDYVDGDAFDQDLFIKRIPAAVDSVWFDTGSTMQDRSDANWAVVLTAIPKSEYEERFPKGSGMSVGDDRKNNSYWQKAEKVSIGRLLYKKPIDIEIVQMSNGAVYQVDEKFTQIQDELAQQGVVEERRRMRKSSIVCSRLFDGANFLNEPEKTVFSHLPIIPVYGNFDVVENKVIYHGKVEKLYDQQRSLNYAMSRDIQDGALSPSPTVWMTRKMAKGNDYSRMNMDKKPVRFFEIDEDNPNLLPTYVGGPQSSQGLQTTIANMQQMIATTANSFNAQQGNANPTQSGVAGAQQIDQGNIGSIKWFKPLEVAICQTGKVLLDAIPKVYDSTRQVRILEEDGTGRMVTLNEKVLDRQTQQIVELNNLAQGNYDVMCEVGPAFNNQQRETAQAFMEMAAIDPSFLQQGKDIWLKNQQSPGMDQMAERARKELFNAGMIPETQWTDEERAEYEQQQAMAAQQPPQEDPMMVAARAEEMKAQADIAAAQSKQMEVQSNQQLKMFQLQLEQQKLQLDAAKFEREKEDKYNVDLINADQNQQKIDLQAQNQQFVNMMAMQKQMVDALNTQADTLNKLRDAMGVDAIVGDSNMKAYTEQAEIVQDSQEGIE